MANGNPPQSPLSRREGAKGNNEMNRQDACTTDEQDAYARTGKMPVLLIYDSFNINQYSNQLEIINNYEYTR